jgi:MFS transporter, DHA2 family, multidrug resistance protein
MQGPYPPPLTRWLITVFALSAAFMTQLDATIANVALPHMQASTSASREQIAWVLTSYLIMAAIFTPLSGWLAERIGRKRVIVGSIIGFTIASLLCGIAANLEQLIIFRLLQGIMGCALLPMSQAVLLDINPPEKHGSAMAVWGFGAVLGPIVGPLLGGVLTENLNWRWVFLCNLPVGVIAAIGLAIVMKDSAERDRKPLDMLGFASLALAVGTFQLMLDRGQLLDWFQSTEIWIEATISATAFYVFIVHSLTAQRPFVRLSLFRDRNFVVGNVFGFFLGGIMYGVVALLAPMLAELMHYPIELIGIVTAPRGLGTMLIMPFIGRLADRIDPRILILAGLTICGSSMWILSGSSLEMDSWPVILGGFVQGAGAGIMFVPIAAISFATLNPRLRNEAAAFNSLVRNLGAAVWITLLQTATIRNTEIVHSRLAEGVRPDNPAVAWQFPNLDMSLPGTAVRLDAEVGRQALMVAYIDSFWVILVACVVIAPLVLLLRRPRQGFPTSPEPGLMLD